MAKFLLDKDNQKLHLEHAMSNVMVSSYLSGPKNMKRVNTLPICPKCERIGLRDKGWSEKMIMSCPHCGYHGATDTVYSEYVKNKNFL